MSPHVRVIARLDIKGAKLIKGVRLEGLRVVGDPHEHALRYAQQGADELVLMDAVASLYQRNQLADIVRQVSDQVFIPITVGGGIRTLDDVSRSLNCGADKVAINTAALARPALIDEVARRYGAQCMVISIEAKRTGPNQWEAYTDCGRERSGLDVVQWVQEAVSRGAGEVLVTSVDQEGTRKGFDLDLIAQVAQSVRVPVMASGGLGQASDLVAARQQGACGVVVADALHWQRLSLHDLKQVALDAGLDVRPAGVLPKGFR